MTSSAGYGVAELEIRTPPVILRTSRVFPPGMLYHFIIFNTMPHLQFLSNTGIPGAYGAKVSKTENVTEVDHKPRTLACKASGSSFELYSVSLKLDHY